MVTLTEAAGAVARARASIVQALRDRGADLREDAGLAAVPDAIQGLPSGEPWAVEFLNGRVSCQNMFYGANQLTRAPMFDTSACMAFASMFYGCSSLVEVPAYDTSKGRTFGSMFYGCSSLVEVPALNMAGSITTSGMFTNCANVERVRVYGFTRSLDFSPCEKLTAQALNEVFHNAGTAATSSQTITITGCAGAGQCDRSIAEEKGWTITG